MRDLGALSILCVALTSIFTSNLIASQCPSCVDAESNACRRWGSGHATFQWASGDRVSSGITLTAGPCGQGGESAVGYIMVDCDTHSATCNGSPELPCNDGLYPADAFAIVKVIGNKKAFQQMFPDGIAFTGDRVYEGSNGSRFYRATAVTQANCEYKVPLAVAGHCRIKVAASVSGCDAEFDNSRFNIMVKIFEEVGNQYVQDRYTLLTSTMEQNTKLLRVRSIFHATKTKKRYRQRLFPTEQLDGISERIEYTERSFPETKHEDIGTLSAPMLQMMKNAEQHGLQFNWSSYINENNPRFMIR